MLETTQVASATVTVTAPNQYSRKRLLSKNPPSNKINEKKPPNSEPGPPNTFTPEEEMTCVDLDGNLSTVTRLSTQHPPQARRPITKCRLTEVKPSIQHVNHRRKSGRLI